jgi:hypothetical protein
MKTTLLLVCALALLGAIVVAPVAEAAPPNVCLSYWYCIPHCLVGPHDYCDCKPECAPQ